MKKIIKDWAIALGIGFLFFLGTIMLGQIYLARAYADPVSYAPVCKTDLWGFLGTQRRTICDYPKGDNGEWMRHRTVWTPAHTTPIYCSGSYGFYSCSGGQFVRLTVTGDESYPVTDAIVLPDEPAHLGR